MGSKQTSMNLDMDSLVKKKAELEASYAMTERQLMSLQNELSYMNGVIYAVSHMNKDKEIADGNNKS